MGNLKEKALKESQKIVENLIVQTPQGKTFQFESFIQGLGEEIEDLWKSEIKNGFATFHLYENGSLGYDGLSINEVKGPTNISVPIILKEEKIIEVTDVFALREKHNQEKDKIVADLDKLSSNFDKLLIETVKIEHESKKKEATSIKEAEDILNKDIAIKKQKLLEKLLGEK